MQPLTTHHRPSDEVVLEWDIDSWRPALRCWEQRVAGESFERGLEIGARDGGVSLWLSERCAEVVCSDVGPMDGARTSHASQGVTNITYQEIDARAIPYREAFDVIAFKSVIGAVGGIGGEMSLANQQLAFREIHAALRPGGILLFAENLAASPLHRSMRRRFNPWAANWRYPSLFEMQGFLAAFGSHELRATGVIAAFGRGERQRGVLAQVDRTILAPITPVGWKYIAYGWAIK